MNNKSLNELNSELIVQGENCVFNEKFNTIYFNDAAYKKHTVSIYEKDDSFRVAVKVKGKNFESTTPKERKECIDIKNELVARLNQYGYSFEGVKPLEQKKVQSPAPTAYKGEDAENPFAGLMDE